MAKQNSGRLLVASAAAGLFMAASAATPVLAGSHGEAAAGGSSEVPCYGINKCKGTGECGGKGYSCAGNNECGGHGWLKLDKEKCLKIKGGRLTAEEEKTES